MIPFSSSGRQVENLCHRVHTARFSNVWLTMSSSRCSIRARPPCYLGWSAPCCDALDDLDLLLAGQADENSLAFCDGDAPKSARSSAGVVLNERQRFSLSLLQERKGRGLNLLDHLLDDLGGTCHPYFGSGPCVFQAARSDRNCTARV